jgi:hypothetical protein
VLTRGRSVIEMDPEEFVSRNRVVRPIRASLGRKSHRNGVHPLLESQCSLAFQSAATLAR